jgi:hypothetical protein
MNKSSTAFETYRATKDPSQPQDSRVGVTADGGLYLKPELKERLDAALAEVRGGKEPSPYPTTFTTVYTEDVALKSAEAMWRVGFYGAIQRALFIHANNLPSTLGGMCAMLRDYCKQRFGDNHMIELATEDNLLLFILRLDVISVYTLAEILAIPPYVPNEE